MKVKTNYKPKSFQSKTNSLSQNPLVKKILFTIILLAAYRLGSYIPLPFVDASKLANITKYTENGILGMLNMLSGGSLSRMSIFTLTIVP